MYSISQAAGWYIYTRSCYKLLQRSDLGKGKYLEGHLGSGHEGGKKAAKEAKNIGTECRRARQGGAEDNCVVLRTTQPQTAKLMAGRLR